MRTIGLLGGMSWESTAEYYRLANETVRERLGGLHSARLVLYSVDFAEIAALQAAGQWDEAGQLLGQAAKGARGRGCRARAHLHEHHALVAEQVQAAVSIPLLHIVDTTADAVRAAGLGRVGLLGTRFTMEQPFYRDRMARHGVELVVPDEADRAEVHRVIFDELCVGVVRDESREAYRAVDRAARRGRRAGHRARLHRDRAAGGARRQPRAAVPDDAAARRGGAARSRRLACRG